MSSKRKTEQYRYYWRGKSDVDAASVDQALQLSRSRLRASIRDLDYLVLRARRENLERYSTCIEEGELDVLDIGGRIQPYRALFGDRVRSYLAIDPQLEGLTNVVGVGEQLPFRNGTFSLVLCTQVLSYVRQPEVVLLEMHRVLKPGGHLILTTPAFFPEHFDERWRLLPNGLRTLLSDFTILDISPEGHSWAGLFRALNIFLHAEIESWRVQKIVSWTTIPLLNILGAIFDKWCKDDRCAANYDLHAVKRSNDS